MVIGSEIFSAETVEIRKLGNSGFGSIGNRRGHQIHRLQENLKAEKTRLLQKICAPLPEHMQAAVGR